MLPSSTFAATAPGTQGRRRLLALSVLAYLASTALGVVMRFDLIGLSTGIEFDHLLHAHSHTLYFGWAGLGVLVLATDLLPQPSALLRKATTGIALLIPAIFVGFLALGYHPVTIALSTAVMFGWYLAVMAWWRQARFFGGVGVRLLRTAFTYLLIASLGVWALGVLQATGVGTTLDEALAIHAFLLGYAWFLVVAVVGLITAHAESLGLRLDERAVSRAHAWWLPLAWITFPLGVVQGPEVAWLGPAARVAGLVMVYPGWVWIRTLWRATPPGRTGRLWRVTSAWFVIPVLATGAVALIGSPALAAVGRHGVVIYLHALLVGFVSTALVMLHSKRIPTAALELHTATLALMLAGIGLITLGAATTGGLLAAVAALGLWVAGLLWARALLSRVDSRD